VQPTFAGVDVLEPKADELLAAQAAPEHRPDERRVAVCDSLASGGSPWAANTKISDDPGTTAQTKARIGVDGANNLVAAWIDARTSPAHVRVARKPSERWRAAALRERHDGDPG